jgi:hypothetical protein
MVLSLSSLSAFVQRHHFLLSSLDFRFCSKTSLVSSTSASAQRPPYFLSSTAAFVQSPHSPLQLWHGSNAASFSLTSAFVQTPRYYHNIKLLFKDSLINCSNLNNCSLASAIVSPSKLYDDLGIPFLIRRFLPLRPPTPPAHSPPPRRPPLPPAVPPLIAGSQSAPSMITPSPQASSATMPSPPPPHTSTPTSPPSRNLRFLLSPSPPGTRPPAQTPPWRPWTIKIPSQSGQSQRSATWLPQSPMPPACPPVHA